MYDSLISALIFFITGPVICGIGTPFLLVSILFVLSPISARDILPSLGVHFFLLVLVIFPLTLFDFEFLEIAIVVFFEIIAKIVVSLIYWVIKYYRLWKPVLITLALAGFVSYVYNTTPAREELRFPSEFRYLGVARSLEDLQRIQENYPDAHCTLPEDGTGMEIIAKVEHRESEVITSYFCYPTRRHIHGEGFIMGMLDLRDFDEVKTDVQIENDHTLLPESFRQIIVHEDIG